MRTRSEIESGRLAPAANFDVVSGIVADRDRGMREIRDGEEEQAQALVEFGDALVELLDLLRGLLHLGGDRGDVFAGLLAAADVLAGAIAEGLELLGFGDQAAALAVDRLEALEVDRDAAVFRHFADDVEMVANESQIEHRTKE